MAKFFLQTLIFTLLSGAVQMTQAQQPSSFTNAAFAAGFEAVISTNPILAQDGGAGLIEMEGKRFFISVGVTAIKGKDPAERVRQLRVAKVNALRAMAEFIQSAKVETETRLTEKTTIETDGKNKIGKTFKELDETTRSSVTATLQAPEQVGTWKSKDGSLFYLALGRQLP